MAPKSGSGLLALRMPSASAKSCSMPRPSGSENAIGCPMWFGSGSLGWLWKALWRKLRYPGCELFMGEGGRFWSLRWLGHSTGELSFRVSVASLLTEPQLSGVGI